MTVRSFLFGLTAAFAFPWLALVAVPYGKMKAMEPREIDAAEGTVYPPPNRGLVQEGNKIYIEQGCHECHTQVVRPTYAGPDRWRPGWAGDPKQARETQPLDYEGVERAALGKQRIGPDLANVGFRITDPAWHYQHLYDPRSVHPWSIMPSYAHLFEKRRVEGQPSDLALDVEGIENGWEVVPTTDAKDLVTYLLSLRKDAPVTAPEATGATAP